MQTIIDMKFKKETKRTVVYINEAPGVAVSQVYVQKSALPAIVPQKIVLSIETEEE